MLHHWSIDDLLLSQCSSWWHTTTLAPKASKWRGSVMDLSISSTESAAAGTLATDMQFESPPHHVRVADTAGLGLGTSTITSSMAAWQGEVHDGVPLLSTPVRNNIARITDKHDDPFFDREESVNGVATLIYKEMGPFTTEVSVEELNQIVSIRESGLSWVTAKGDNVDPHCRSNTFRKWILPLVPPHLALAFDQPILFGFSKKEDDGVPIKQSGRHRLFPAFIVGMKGICSAKIHGCPSFFACGFTEESIKTLLFIPCPETISLSMEVRNACIHQKGVTYGQLRGPARHKVIDDFIRTGQQPSEYAKTKLKNATDSQFHSKNLGAVVTKAGVGNLSRESKQKKMSAAGLTSCKLSNIPIAQSITNQRDVDARTRIKDQTTDCLGILRKLELAPDLRIVLYTKPCVQLFQHLVKGGRLILHCDATGNLLNFPMVDLWKDKVLHTKLCFSPKYVIMGGDYTRDKTVSRLLSPLTIAEMASNKNTANDVADFFNGFLASVTESFPDKETEKPLIIMTDCSPQLQTGALKTFSSGAGGMASTRMEYGNIVLLHLLFYDKALSDISSGINTTTLRTDLAKQVLASLRIRVGIFLKECRSHVYRAAVKWVHMQKDNEIATLKSRFENMLKSVFDKVTREPKISVAIVQLSVVVALLETEKFDSASFDDTMETKDCRGPVEKEADDRMLRDISSFIRVESEMLRITSLEDVSSRVGDKEAMMSNHILLHDGIIDRAKVLMKGQCRTYLRSVSTSNGNSLQKMGTVRCSITYGHSFLVGDDGNQIAPWFEGGFDVSLEFPHNGQDGIANPLYSPTMSTYLRGNWMRKFPLWSRGIIYLIEAAMDMQIEDNNQFSEAVFKNIKHNTDVYEHVFDPGDYIMHRYDDSDNCTKQFVHQYEMVHGKVAELINRRAKRKRRAVETDNAASMVMGDTDTLLTQDELTQLEEESGTEIWSRRGSVSEMETKLRNDLVETFLEHKDGVGGNSYRKKHQYLEACVGTQRISGPTFRDFMKKANKSTSGLSAKHREVLQEFVDKKRLTKVVTLPVSLPS